MPVTTRLAYERQRFLSFLSFFQKLTIALGGFFVLFFFTTFLLIQSIFTTTLESSIHEEALIDPEQGALLLHAAEFNTQIDRLSQLLQHHPQWENLFREFDALMNETVLVSQLEVGLARSVSFSGVARDRDALLTLRSKLDQSSIFTPITLPLSLLLEKNSIPFSFDIQLKDPDLLYNNASHNSE